MKIFLEKLFHLFMKQEQKRKMEHFLHIKTNTWFWEPIAHSAARPIDNKEVKIMEKDRNYRERTELECCYNCQGNTMIGNNSHCHKDNQVVSPIGICDDFFALSPVLRDAFTKEDGVKQSGNSDSNLDSLMLNINTCIDGVSQIYHILTTLSELKEN